MTVLEAKKKKSPNFQWLEKKNKIATVSVQAFEQFIVLNADFETIELNITQSHVLCSDVLARNHQASEEKALLSRGRHTRVLKTRELNSHILDNNNNKKTQKAPIAPRPSFYVQIIYKN